MSVVGQCLILQDPGFGLMYASLLAKSSYHCQIKEVVFNMLTSQFQPLRYPPCHSSVPSLPDLLLATSTV